MSTCAIAAMCIRSDAPIEPVAGTTGWTRALSRSTNAWAIGRLAPEPPRAMPLSRAAIAARTTAAGSGSPTAPSCAPTMSACISRSDSRGSGTSRWCPRPVLSPYTSAGPSTTRSTIARLASITRQASSPRRTRAPFAIATRSSSASSSVPITTSGASTTVTPGRCRARPTGAASRAPGTARPSTSSRGTPARRAAG